MRALLATIKDRGADDRRRQMWVRAPMSRNCSSARGVFPWQEFFNAGYCSDAFTVYCGGVGGLLVTA